MAVEFSWPILGVIIPSLLIACAGYGTYFYILVPHHTSQWQLVWFQFSLCMTWLSYFLAIVKQPGSTPANFQYASKEWKRYCIKCDSYKPERTHHCRQCNKCVLKMDHHCPWTYNCVGNNNMPHFIRFLCWVCVTSGYALYQLILRAIDLYKSRNMPAYMVPKYEIVAPIVLIPVVAFVLLSVGLLTIRVFVNIFNGQTQIETWECERIDSLTRRGLVNHVDFPYDIDPWTNLVNAWGPVYSWVLPWGGPGTDGLHFEKNEVVDDGSVWPPDHRDQHAPTSTRPSLDMPRTLGYATSSRRSTPPEWRRNITRDDDFYRTDQWHNFEGERISDFGVDIETIATPPPLATTNSEHAYQDRDDFDHPDDNVPLARLIK